MTVTSFYRIIICCDPHKNHPHSQEKKVNVYLEEEGEEENTHDEIGNEFCVVDMIMYFTLIYSINDVAIALRHVMSYSLFPTRRVFDV